LFQTKGVSDGQNPITNPEFFRIADLNDGKTVRRFYFYERNVRFGISADNPGIIFSPVRKFDTDLFGLLNNMIVCKNIAVRTDDKTRPQAFLFEFPLWDITEESLKKFVAAEITIKGTLVAERRPVATAGANRLGGVDIDHRGFQFFHDIRKGQGSLRRFRHGHGAGCFYVGTRFRKK
jgi:hypothetical protein